MRCLLVILSLSLLTPLSAHAQLGDPCDDADAIMSISTAEGGPTDFYAVTGSSTEFVGSLPYELNSLGYLNGSFYAMEKRSNEVLEFSLSGEAGITDRFVVTGMPESPYRAGAVRPETSDYYVVARYFAKFRRIPLGQNGEGYSNVAITGAGSLIDVGDVAFWNGLIVGYDSGVEALLRFDPDTGASSYVQVPGVTPQLFGAAYVLGESLFLYSDDEKSIYEVDPTNGDVLGVTATPFVEPTRQIDAASCAAEPVDTACEPVLDLRADVLAMALPEAVTKELLADLDAALVNCSRGEYTLTAVALTRFLTTVGLQTGITIDVSDSELLTSVAQSLISGLPEDTTGNPCTPILDLRADVLGLGVSDALEDALLADLDLALVSCASGALPDAISALNSFIGTVTLNTGLFGEISVLESTALIASAEAIISVLSGAVRTNPRASRAREGARGQQEARAGLHAAVETRVFPNPATTRAIVQAPGPFRAKVYDTVGREVMEVVATADMAELDVQDLSAGLYVVRIDAADGFHTAKVTVSR